MGIVNNWVVLKYGRQFFTKISEDLFLYNCQVERVILAIF